MRFLINERLQQYHEDLSLLIDAKVSCGLDLIKTQLEAAQAENRCFKDRFAQIDSISDELRQVFARKLREKSDLQVDLQGIREKLKSFEAFFKHELRIQESKIRSLEVLHQEDVQVLISELRKMTSLKEASPLASVPVERRQSLRKGPSQLSEHLKTYFLNKIAKGSRNQEAQTQSSKRVIYSSYERLQEANPRPLRQRPTQQDSDSLQDTVRIATESTEQQSPALQVTAAPLSPQQQTRRKRNSRLMSIRLKTLALEERPQALNIQESSPTSNTASNLAHQVLLSPTLIPQSFPASPLVRSFHLSRQ